MIINSIFLNIVTPTVTFIYFRKSIPKMFNFYFLDWAVFITFILSLKLTGSLNKNGFLLGMLSCIFAIALGILINSIPNIATSTVAFFIYLQNYWKWSKGLGKSDSMPS